MQPPPFLVIGAGLGREYDHSNVGYAFNPA